MTTVRPRFSDRSALLVIDSALAGFADVVSDRLRRDFGSVSSLSWSAGPDAILSHCEQQGIDLLVLFHGIAELNVSGTELRTYAERRLSLDTRVILLTPFGRHDTARQFVAADVADAFVEFAASNDLESAAERISVLFDELKLPLHRVETVGANAIGDRPADRDSFGFDVYVNSLAEFLLHPTTQPPLTVSVEGPWGSGKSSFLLQFRNAVHWRSGGTARIVSFNAWRLGKNEQVWASFAMELLTALRREAGFFKRVVADVRLAAERFNLQSGGFALLRVAALLGAAGVMGSIALVAIGRGIDPISPAGTDLQEWAKAILVSVAAGSSIAAVVTAIQTTTRLLKTVATSAASSLRAHLEHPDYSSNLAFVEQFHSDLKRILRSYIRSQERVFVLIDDLDRCQARQAADLIQAIAMMIGDEGPLFFVIAMDRDRVAASVALRDKKFIALLDGKGAGRELAYGRRYLEKFIQIRVPLPQPSSESVAQFIETLNPTPSTRPAHDLAPERIVATVPSVDNDAALPPIMTTGAYNDFIVRTSADSREIRRVARLVSAAVGMNPRQLKQFINLYRFRALVSYRRGLFTDGHLSLESLAKFVAIELHWPDLLSDIVRSADLVEQLASDAVSADAIFHRWKKDDRLLQLLSSDGGPLTTDMVMRLLGTARGRATRLPQHLQTMLQRVAQNAMPSVLRISSMHGGLLTGFFCGLDGLIYTSSSVTNLPPYLLALRNSKEETGSGQVWVVDAKSKVALLTSQASSVPLSLEAASRPTFVVMLGHTAEESYVCAFGRIAHDLSTPEQIVVDAEIPQGFSGAPVLARDGRLVGMITHATRTLVYVVPAATLATLFINERTDVKTRDARRAEEYMRHTQS